MRVKQADYNYDKTEGGGGDQQDCGGDSGQQLRPESGHTWWDWEYYSNYLASPPAPRDEIIYEVSALTTTLSYFVLL